MGQRINAMRSLTGRGAESAIPENLMHNARKYPAEVCQRQADAARSDPGGRKSA